MERIKEILSIWALRWFGATDYRVVLELFAMGVLCFITAIGAWLAILGVIKS